MNNEHDDFKEKLLYIKELVESGYCDRLIMECELYDDQDSPINTYLKNNLSDPYKDMKKAEEQIMDKIG